MAPYTAAAPRFRAIAATAAVAMLLAASACAEEGANTDGAATDDMAAAVAADSVEVPGFETPESVLHDEAADIYLVSNINGAPLAEDDNGFISRVSPAGEVVELRWIDGAAGNVTLNAPKGSAIRGDTLFVADINVVRLFNRRTGEPLGNWPVEGASFLNDADVGPDGALYITDSGLAAGEGGFTATGTDAVYRFEDGTPVVVARGAALSAPNGVVADSLGTIIAPFAGDAVYSLNEEGQPTSLVTLPAGQLDGLVRLDDGSFLVSSWQGQAVYHARPGDPEGYDVMAEVEGVEAPADIGYDARRGRVLIPLFNEGTVLILTVH